MCLLIVGYPARLGLASSIKTSTMLPRSTTHHQNNTLSRNGIISILSILAISILFICSICSIATILTVCSEGRKELNKKCDTNSNSSWLIIVSIVGRYIVCEPCYMNRSSREKETEGVTYSRVPKTQNVGMKHECAN